MRELLRRRGATTHGMLASLRLLNLATWIPFVVAVDRFSGPRGTGWNVLAFEVVVVLGEACLLTLASGRWAQQGRLPAALPFGDALGVAVLGNLVSIAVTIGPYAGLALALA